MACPDFYASTRYIKAIRTGARGLYHINAVDQVTQWEIVAAASQISELWLLPVLEALLAQFPFVIRSFHSDNGSEFINYNVARLLGKLLIEQTKSRAHHTGDNGLVESKNGAIIRKHIGHGHIDAQHAEAMDQFHRQHLNPYVNLHRPCAVPKILTEANGKRRRVYERWATPLELFREVPRCESFLRPHVTLAELDRLAQVRSDTEAALDMQRAKCKLFQSFQTKRNK
jgi:Integrase core domain.